MDYRRFPFYYGDPGFSKKWSNLIKYYLDKYVKFEKRN